MFPPVPESGISLVDPKHDPDRQAESEILRRHFSSSSQIKRLLDLALSGFAVILLFPIFVATALLVFLKMGRPIFFRQVRPGKNGHPFSLLKFRTMKSPANGQSIQIQDDEMRLTGLGKFLRRSCLDEIPQLWSVLKGDMSLVGPRPLLIKYLELYTPRQNRRHEMLPGMTGWAQITDSPHDTWDSKLEMDLWYVENWSLGLDIKILILTVMNVYRRSRTKTNGLPVRGEFMGSRPPTEN